MLFLSKLLPALLFPLGLALLLGLAASWLAFRKGARPAGGLALAATLLLWVFSTPYVGNALLLGLESRNPPEALSPKADAIVLLGGALLAPGAPRLVPETGAAGDRVLHAARLWKQQRAPRIVTTGGYIPFLAESASSEAEQYASLLVELFDVPRAAIALVPGSRNTHEDAVLASALFDSTGWSKHILLVTSATHMPRASALFRKNGFIVHPAPTDFNGTVNRSTPLFQFVPAPSALENSTIALKEHVGLLAYRMMGRL